MVKIVAMARSRIEAEQARDVWLMPPAPYGKLWWSIRDSVAEFPLLHAVCAHDEGPDGHFEVRPEQIPRLVAEIDLLLSRTTAPELADLKDMLLHFRRLADMARMSHLTIFGFAD